MWIISWFKALFLGPKCTWQHIMYSILIMICTSRLSDLQSADLRFLCPLWLQHLLQCMCGNNMSVPLLAEAVTVPGGEKETAAVSSTTKDTQTQHFLIFHITDAFIFILGGVWTFSSRTFSKGNAGQLLVSNMCFADGTSGWITARLCLILKRYHK